MFKRGRGNGNPHAGAGHMTFCPAAHPVRPSPTWRRGATHIRNHCSCTHRDTDNRLPNAVVKKAAMLGKKESCNCTEWRRKAQPRGAQYTRRQGHPSRLSVRIPFAHVQHYMGPSCLDPQRCGHLLHDAVAGEPVFVRFPLELCEFLFPRV